MTTQLIHSDQLTPKIPHRQKRENSAQNEVELHPAARPHFASPGDDNQSPVLLCFAGVPGNCSFSAFHKNGLVTLFTQTLALIVTTGK